MRTIIELSCRYEPNFYSKKLHSSLLACIDLQNISIFLKYNDRGIKKKNQQQLKMCRKKVFVSRVSIF